MRSTLEACLPYVVWAWAAGVALLLTRFAGGSWRVHRLRVVSRAEPTSPWQAVGERIAKRLGLVVAFRVVESALVDTPSVIGFMRPLVLLPIAALSSLSPGQVEALLAHELAHIRRRDYAVNLLQTVAETLLFFHPAIWWVSSRIREAREYLLRRRRGRGLRRAGGVCRSACGTGYLEGRRRCSVGWRHRWAAPRAGPQAARRTRGACAPVDRRAGRCGGCNHAGGRRRSAIEPAEVTRAVPRISPSHRRHIRCRQTGSHARRIISISTTHRTLTCTPSAPRRKPSARTNASAQTCDTTSRSGCQSSCSATLRSSR